MERLANRARQWSRTAWALALLFASLPVASKLFVGIWGFDGAAPLAFICALAGIYFHWVGRRRSAAMRDTAAMLDQAMRLARDGQTERAIALLSQAVRLSPRVWQGFQYRGELHLLESDPGAAFRDFTEAIRLAPEELHLRVLRDRAQQLLDRPDENQSAPG